MAEPAVSLAEILEIVRRMPPPDLEAITAVRQGAKATARGAAALGRLVDIAEWMAGWQGKAPPDCRHPRLSIFAASHGVAVARGSDTDEGDHLARLKARVAAFQQGTAPAVPACTVADADLRVYELDLDTPSGDITQGPALDAKTAAQAMAYGMMGVDQGLHLIGLATMAEGGEVPAAAVACALFGGDPGDWLAGGNKPAEHAVLDALDANRPAIDGPLDALAALGGADMCAVAGAIVAARLARTPVLLDGMGALAAAAALHAVDPRAIDHCLAAHRGAHPGEARLLDALGRQAVLDLGLGALDGAGAAIAMPVVKSAVEIIAEAG